MKNYKDQEVFTKYYNVIGEIVNKNTELERKKQTSIKDIESLTQTENNQSVQINSIDEEITSIENKIDHLNNSILKKISIVLGIYLIGVLIVLGFGGDMATALAWPISALIILVIIGIFIGIASS